MPDQNIQILSAVFLSLLVPTTPALPQQHEPDIEWRTLRTEHFSVHFPTEHEELGRRIAALCEDVYEPVSASLNYRPGRTEVVLHTRTDDSNGLASPLPWRIELYVREPSDNWLGSRDEWLRLLITHEFTHIVHLRKHRGFSSLTRPFLGELNSFWQALTPIWFIEGFPTYNETDLTLGGRGRNAYHRMQMEAPVFAGSEWKLDNTNYVSRKHLPTGMHYVSGYYMASHVEKRFGDDAWRRILDRYSSHPFLGFGSAVKHVTSESPGEIYATMVHEIRAEERSRATAANTAVRWYESELPDNLHSPRWVDDDRLLIYRLSFDNLPELAFLDRSGNLERLTRRRLASRDNGFSVSERYVVWAELRPHPQYAATLYSDLMLYDRTTDELRLLTDGERVMSPDFSPDGSLVAAVQTHHPGTRLVSVSVETGEIKTLLDIPGQTILNPRWSPDGNRIAFALKDATGIQDIAVFDLRSGRWRILYRQDIHHDNNPCWSPDGSSVLYASDLSGVFNIWAVNVASGRRWMVTDEQLGAFSPDVSPQGELAFTAYTFNGFAPASMSLDSAEWTEESVIEQVDYPRGGSDIRKGTALPSSLQPSTQYNPWGQVLRPQGRIPLLVRDESGMSPGLFAISGDALNRHLWQGIFALSPSSGRPYADLYYTYSRYNPEIDLRAYYLPARVNAVTGEKGWWRKRGAVLSAGLPITLERNVYGAYLRPYLGIKIESRERSTGVIYPLKKRYGSFRAGITFSRSGRTLRDIVPHRAVAIALSGEWSSGVLGSEFTAQQARGRINLFFPTFIAHHGLQFLGMAQNRRGNYSYGFYGAMPTGYDDDSADWQLRFKTGYHFPIAYVEWKLPLLPVYLDYVAAEFFHDWGASRNGAFGGDMFTGSGRYSTGIRLTFSNFVFQAIPVRLGGALFYKSIDGGIDSDFTINFGIP